MSIAREGPICHLHYRSNRKHNYFANWPSVVKIEQYLGTKRENENFPCTSRVVSLAVDMEARLGIGPTTAHI
jgi:hypothetical protein